MTTRWPKLVTASVSAAAVIVAVAIITLKRIDAGIAASVEHKSAKHATATVTNVVEMESRTARSEKKRVFCTKSVLRLTISIKSRVICARDIGLLRRDA
jgi:hypothetical protein